MNKDLLRTLIHLKLEISNQVIHRLPTSIQTPLLQVRKDILEILHGELSSQLHSSSTPQNPENPSSMTTISID
jgi:hypothetical protein